MIIKKVYSTEPEDISVIEKLAKKIWTQHFITILSTDQIEYMLSKFQSAKAISNQIQNQGCIYYIAYEKLTPVGYCAIHPKPDERSLFLSKLYVLKEYRGRGIAKAMLNRSIADIDSKIIKMHLTCNKNNKSSINAYLKMGFKIIDAVKTDIGNNMFMDDYVFSITIKDLNPVD